MKSNKKVYKNFQKACVELKDAISKNKKKDTLSELIKKLQTNK